MRHLILTGLIVIVLSACSETPESTTLLAIIDSPTPNQILVTPDMTSRSRDLPATWTPTFTPTITNTPTATATLTATPSATPIDTDLICENFRFDVSGIDGSTFGRTDTIEVTYGIDSTYHYAFVGVVLEHDDLETIIADVLPGGTDYTSTFVVRDFPISGEWQYRIGVFLVDGDEMLCREAGTFTIEPDAIATDQPSSVSIPTARPVPSITPQPDQAEAQCYLICP